MVPANSRAPGYRLATLLGGLALLACLAPPVRAADLDKLDTSLKIIPADAAYYSTSLRIKEQIDAVAKSRAWAKIWAMPGVQMGWAALEKEYKAGGQLAPVRAFFEDEDNKDLLSLLADAGSHEIFVYGGDSWVGFLQLVQHVSGAFQYEPLKAQLTGEANGHDENQIRVRAVLNALAKNPDLLKVPDFVMGAKITDAKRAEKQLKRLEAILELVTGMVPELKGRFKRVKIRDGSFLTLTLDGSLVPWDQIPLKDFEDKPGEFAPLIRKLKAMTLTVSIGVQEGYLIVSIGGTTDQLAKIGGPGAKLESRPELKPLAKFAGRKITSIGYVSKEMLSHLAGNQDFSSYQELAKLALPKANLPEEQQKRILKDLDDLAKEMKAGVVEVGAMVDFSFLTERGFEAYAYNYTKNRELDGSKPLTLLNHVGGSPILAFVGRSKVTGDGYASFVKWVKVFYGHADEYARANLNGDEKEQYVTMTGKLLPIFKRLDEATAKQFIPALADGQGGFVLDAKWTSKQWLKTLPATEQALPMPEIAIVLGVSDAAKLRKAMAEYHESLNDIIGAVRALSAAAGAIGDFRIPAPESVKRPSGTLYFYELPPILDPRVSPTAGLSEKVAVLTLSHGHAERLLKSTPLVVDGGPLANPNKPLAGALYFNWPALVTAVTPWAEFVANSYLDEQLGQDAPKKARAALLDQVKTVLEVLKVYRGTTAATYVEDGVVVTHSETVIKDLEK